MNRLLSLVTLVLLPGVGMLLSGCVVDLKADIATAPPPQRFAVLGLSTQADPDGVPTNGMLAVTLSTPVDPTSVDAQALVVLHEGEAIPGRVVAQGRTVVFVPASGLPPNATFSATLSGSLRSLQGQSLGQDVAWTFTTSGDVDASPPHVTSSVVAQAADGVAVNGDIIVTFNEELDPGASAAPSFRVTGPDGDVRGDVMVVGPSAIFTPHGELAAGVRYNVTVTDAADLAGNALVEAYGWSFVTSTQTGTGAADDRPPRVLRTFPRDGAQDVGTAADITIVFDEAIRPSTIDRDSFVVRGDTGPVAGNLAASADTVVFRPLQPLRAGAEYRVTVSSAATDLAGNHLATSVTWEFTTASAGTARQEPVHVGAAAEFAVLAGDGVRSTGRTSIQGSVGLHPVGRLDGFAAIDGLPGLPGQGTVGAINGDIHIGDAAAQRAMDDAGDARADVRSRREGALAFSGELGSRTISPGFYHATDLVVRGGNLVLDAQGDADAVFILDATGSIVVESDVVLTGGASARNIVWQAGTTASIGPGVEMYGNVLAEDAVTLASGSVVTGRVVAETGSVTMDSATVIAVADASSEYSRPAQATLPSPHQYALAIVSLALASVAAFVVVALRMRRKAR